MGHVPQRADDVPDGDHFALAFIDADRRGKAESVPFWHYTDIHEAATEMRKWLRGKGLLGSAD
jgi:hypothetical protein